MTGPYFVFLLLPSIAAVAAGWAIRHWALAAALVAGATGCLFIVPLIGGDARFLTPLFTGAGVAGLVLMPLLMLKSDLSLWTRMTVALVVTFAAHFAFLQYAMATR